MDIITKLMTECFEWRAITGMQPKIVIMNKVTKERLKNTYKAGMMFPVDVKKINRVGGMEIYTSKKMKDNQLKFTF